MPVDLSSSSQQDMPYSQALGMFARQRGAFRNFVAIPTAVIALFGCGLSWWAFGSIGGSIATSICIGLPTLGVAYVLGAAYYRGRFTATMELPRIIATDTRLRRGDEIDITYRQRFKKDVEITLLQVQLIKQEWVRYTRGTDTTTQTRNIPLSEDWVEKVPVAEGQTYHNTFRLRVPDDAMHSFDASNNKVRWHIHVELDLPGWVDFRNDYDVEVEAVVNDAAV